MEAPEYSGAFFLYKIRIRTFINTFAPLKQLITTREFLINRKT